MAYLTDRKRAAGLGSAKNGTEHFWNMTVSSYALCVLVPLFIFTFGSILGAPYEEVVAYYARPFPAIIAALTITVGFVHFNMGVRVLIEDYTGGHTRQTLIVVMTCVSYAAVATGLYAIIKLAL
ncbi:MAG: succinate dehydrogenase, hydrophobic membrane anchor protein [Pseudomonadota bacterium]